jgi:DNA-binding NarL/FixJ family response regulator
MRVLVADDHSLFRDGIVSLLEAAGFEVVGQVGDGQAAVDAALSLCPELVLLDINMPTGGMAALRQIKDAMPATRVVMLTMSDDDEDLFQAMQAGADGYLLKSLNTAEFLTELNGLERGEPAMTRKTTAALVRRLAQPGPPPQEPAAGGKLTPRELELLTLCAEGLSNKAIAQRLSVSENTVKYHFKGILQKMGVGNRTEAATLALCRGLVELKPPQ